MLIFPTGNQARFIVVRLIYGLKAINVRRMNNKTELITLYHADKFPFDTSRYGPLLMRNYENDRTVSCTPADPAFVPTEDTNSQSHAFNY